VADGGGPRAAGAAPGAGRGGVRELKTHTWGRTAALYRALGYRVVKTEYSSRGRRHDLLGFLDGLALGVGETLGLQACGGGDFAEHLRKIEGPCRRDAAAWLAAGNPIVVVGWRKLKGRWVPRTRTYLPGDL
jgi:hypothetical protein